MIAGSVLLAGCLLSAARAALAQHPGYGLQLVQPFSPTARGGGLGLLIWRPAGYKQTLLSFLCTLSLSVSLVSTQGSDNLDR